MERKSLVLFSILVLLLAAQEVVLKTKALTEAETEALTEELKEAETEALTEALTEAEAEARPCWKRIPGGCRGCHLRCVRLGGTKSRCNHGRCFCYFPHCPHISDVTEELKEELKEELTEELTEAQMEEQMEEQTEAATCEKLSKFFHGPCFGPIATRRCHFICVRREHAISGRCRGGRCFCRFRHCPAISDVLEE